MRRIISIFLFLFLPLLVGGKSYNQKNFVKEEVLHLYPETYIDYCTRILCNMKLFSSIYRDVLIISEQEKVDFLEVLPILMVENTTANPFAIGKNYRKEYSYKKKRFITKLVSQDEGLFQLNSEYHSYFEAKYWTPYNENEKFDVFNYKHNSKVAIRFYKDLKKDLDNQTFYSVLAYNAGIGNVLNKKVPEITYKKYLQEYIKNKNKINRSK